MSAGGIVGYVNYSSTNVILNNNMFRGKLIAQNNVATSVGGIVGNIRTNSHVTIDQCRNMAEIISIYHCAGIVGSVTSSTVEIINSFNEGNVQILTSSVTYVSAGGILGSIVDSTSEQQSKIGIFNCYNTGNIDNQNNLVYCAAGGIFGSVGYSGENVLIANCYNMGKTTAKFLGIANFSGGILGGFWYNQYETDIKHCYYDETVSNRSVGGSTTEYAQGLSETQIKGQESIQAEDGNSKTLLELLNGYIENNPDGLNTAQWTKWIQNEEGYPVLDI